MADQIATRSLRMLHLEDDPRDAELVRHKLGADGLLCDILVVGDREGFEAALSREAFDLILLDNNLPGYDGISALKHAQLTRPDLPAILISGTVGDDVAVKCLRVGATDYLLKDRLDRLGAAVRRAVHDAESRLTHERTAADLAWNERHKAAILDSVLDCIVTIAGDGRVIEFNSAAERTFGYTKAEAIGRELADLIIPPALRSVYTAGLARYLEMNEGLLIGRLVELTAVRADGSELPVEVAITAIRSEQAPIFTVVLRDITARKHADQTRTLLAAIVDSSDDAIFSVDMDRTILTWNAGAERLYGYMASEMIGQRRTILASGRSTAFTDMLDRSARGETDEPFETQRQRKDGSIVEISLAISPIRNAAGQITGVSAIARDITSRKVVEAELKRLNDEIQLAARKRAEDLELQVVERQAAETAVRGERDRAQRFLDTADVTLLALDVNGLITLINRCGCDLLGWTEAELLGRDFLQMCLPAQSRVALSPQFLTMAGSDLPPLEAPVLTRSGASRLIEWRTTSLKDDAGQVVGTFSSGTDITERSTAAEALRTAEERMRFALESAGVGIWDLDYASGGLRWSPTMEAHYGLQSGTFGGTFEAFMARVHPEDLEAVLDTMRRAVHSGDDFSIQNRAIWPDGTVRWLSGAGRIHLGERGQPVRGVGISLDITERRALESQYQQAQKMEAIGQLAGGVAHDFNNLLAIILGNCELLLDDTELENQHQMDLAEIQKAALSAAGLTRQLLAFSRKEIIEPTLLDLHAILTSMRPMLRRLIREDVDLVLTLRPEQCLVKADRGQVEQIVMNLSVNARDAMPNGGTLTIDVANVELDEHYAKTHLAVAPGPYVTLTVTDTGEGMTPEVQARLFEPFFTTKAVGRGTGLGLASVHGLVTHSGGSINVRSELGRGTSFQVYLRRAVGAELVTAAPAPVSMVRTGRETLLVVEDAEGIRLLATKLLERRGYTVLVAANADHALKLFDENPSISVLLTDVVMPGGSGPELTRRLVGRRPALKVIYMSGYTDEAIVHHGVLDPGIAFLHKPFTAEALELKIREVVAR